MAIRYRITAAVASICLMTAGVMAIPALAQAGSGSFVMVKSRHDYSATLNALEHSVKSNGLMVMGKIDQKAILSMAGLNLAGAESLLVGNPRVGKKLFSRDPAVANVVPARISVWVGKDGATYVGYFELSAQLGAVSPTLARPGEMLDAKFHKIVQEATH